MKNELMYFWRLIVDCLTTNLISYSTNLKIKYPNKRKQKKAKKRLLDFVKKNRGNFFEE